MCSSVGGLNLISESQWRIIEEDIKTSFDAWTSYYSLLILTNKELACSLVPIHVKFNLLKFIFSLDRTIRDIATINRLLCQLNNWINGTE